MIGYYNISAVVPTDSSTARQLAGGFWILNTSIQAFDALFNPFLNDIAALFPIEVAHSTQFAPNVYDWWKVYSPPGAVATIDAQLSSRLLDEKALSLPLPSLAESLRTAYPDLVLLGNLVSGPGVWHAKPPGGLGSMTPAWRKAIVHMSRFHRSKATRCLANLLPSTSRPCGLEPLQRNLKIRADRATDEHLYGSAPEIGAGFGMLPQRSGRERAGPTSGVRGETIRVC